MLNELSKKLAERWVSLLVLPGVLYLSLLYVATALGHAHALDVDRLIQDVTARAKASIATTGAGQAILLVAILIGAAFVGIVAQSLGSLIERILLAAGWRQWRRPSSTVVGLVVKWRRHRWDAAHTNWQAQLSAARAPRPADRPDPNARHRAARKRNGISVEATAEGHPARPKRQSNLTAVLSRMYDLEGAADHLDEAVEVGREAVGGAVAGQPEHALHLDNLARALRARGIHNDGAVDLDLAASAFVQAAQTPAAVSAVRIRAARDAARILGTDRVEQAADLLATAVNLLVETVPRQLRQGDREHAIARFAGLAGEAAAFALADGRGSDEQRTLRALQLLEQGRAVLMSQSLSTRDDLTALRLKRSDLATRFVELRDLLDLSSDVSRFESSTTLTGERRADTERQKAVDRTSVAQELAEVLSEIREVEDFGLPPTVTMLRQEASHGPVIAFNVTPQRGDALLLTSEGASSCELPQLTTEALIERIHSFYLALHDSWASPDGLRRVRAQAELVDVLIVAMPITPGIPGGGRLSFLSACDTAGARTAGLIDGAIHLASALQLCGFPRVIGTMWYVGDGMAVRIADAFYSQLNGNGTDAERCVDTSRSAYALHRVIRSIREEFPRTPSLWAGYLHAGV
ncbi:CHAT domain-containing protein [Streptomyces sp. bgisy126]|uniref:CHAT domain-containing protein n=1 Tax=unclassified Streptomyces TaxID=2593676 RepID=UPI003EBC332E